MVSYITKLNVIETLRQKDITFFTLSDLQKIFSFASRNTLKHLAMRLTRDKIIERLAKNKYLFLHTKKDISDFEIANFLVVPSYISLESALSYYGIITQFPYQISSITLLKTRFIKVRNKTFHYSKINREYFKDFVKIDNFIIASRNKAVFDYLYFAYKGLRTLSNLGDLAKHLEDKNLRLYIKENAKSKFINFLKKYVKL